MLLKLHEKNMRHQINYLHIWLHKLFPQMARGAKKLLRGVEGTFILFRSSLGETFTVSLL